MPSKRTGRKSSKKSSAFDGIKSQLRKGELDALIEKYRDQPDKFLNEFGKMFPPKLRTILYDVFSLRVRRAALVATRGGGKSQFFSCIASVLYLFKEFDILMLGGSAAQSKADYNYTSEILTDNEIIEEFSEDILTTVTTAKQGNWLKCLAASGTSVRGPHAGDPHKQLGNVPHGGCLIIDEECEAKEDIVKGALPTVNTADPSVILRGSTFHNAVGTFADLIDHAAEYGYTVYQWSCFDICRSCEDDCAECFVELAGPLHPDWPEFVRENPGLEPGCAGMAKLGEGWMKIDEIKQFFREMSWDEFEVEMLGRRASAEGLVLDPNHIEACIVPDTSYMPGMPIVICIDWGLKGLACVVVLQEQEDHAIAILDAADYHLAPDSVIYQRCKDHRQEYNVWEINADASHPYQNLNLAQDYGFTVREIQFNKFKDLGAGALKNWTEKHRLKIPRRFTKLISQCKLWRKKDGKIVKDRDHYPDSLLCGAIKWAEVVIYPIEGTGTGQVRDSIAMTKDF